MTRCNRNDGNMKKVTVGALEIVDHVVMTSSAKGGIRAVYWPPLYGGNNDAWFFHPYFGGVLATLALPWFMNCAP